MSNDTTTMPGLWSDPSLPAAERAAALLAAMTLEEKIAQLYGVWVGAAADGGEVAPHQHEYGADVDLDAILPNGLGQLTRPFGTAPIDATAGARSLHRTQERIVATGRFGIPAIAHEECLAGFAAWGATAYPVPLSWAATFSPELSKELGRRIGGDLRSVGIHQGLAPVLDVVRDARWGRVEETLGEDPLLVGSIGAGYVRGLEDAGIVATLKHFVGYSASKAGRNLAPVSAGPREIADVLLPPFEMALRLGGARSVMNAYTDIDGVPSAADPALLTGLLREQWGFRGTVVSDYFTFPFLAALHGVAADEVDAAALALAAGIDVELPTVRALGPEFRAAVRDGRIPESLVDVAAERVLRQKVELGLLDPDWSAVPPALADASVEHVDLDPPANRDLARRIAERAIVLLRNDGTLPAAPDRVRSIAVIGPNADDPYAVLGCYSFPSHVGRRYPDLPLGIALPTLLESVRAEYPNSTIEHVPGTSVDGGETDGIPAAVAAAERAELVVLALGDRAGLFGRGTSGEGCDAESLQLPGAQQALLDALLATSTSVIVVLLAGRPYALGSAPERAAGILEAFFVGEEGTPAIAGVLSGRVNPSGRLPVSVPAHAGVQPSTYLAAPLAERSGVSNIDPTPAYPFGHGLGYSPFVWEREGEPSSEWTTGGTLELGIRLANAGDRAGADVVQLYLHDPVASVVRPVRRLIGFARVELDAGEHAVVRFRLPADLASFTGVDGRRIVEPGDVELLIARSSADIAWTHRIRMTGPVRTPDHTRALQPDVTTNP